MNNYKFTAHGQPNVKVFIETLWKLLGERHGVVFETIFRDDDESRKPAPKKEAGTYATAPDP